MNGKLDRARRIKPDFEFKTVICFCPGECDPECNELTKDDLKNIIEMIEFQKRLVDKDMCHILTETDKIHALLYLDILKQKFIKR